MTAHRWFRYPALIMIVGFVAVSSIAGGGAVINIGHGIHSKNVKPIAAPLDDWKAQWQWAPATLVSASSAANPRPANSDFFIAYHSDALALSNQGRPQLFYADTGRIVAQNHHLNHKRINPPREATQLHIQF